MPDLITTARVTGALPTLTAAQTTLLPTLITAASQAIQKWCGRDFVRATYDEIYRPGQDGRILLHQWPVNGVSRVAGSRSTVLQIQNTDTTTNQRATVEFAFTGDAAGSSAPLVYTGLAFTRVASGATTTNNLTFAANPTVNALTAAINALGGGWNATVQAPTDKSGLWDSTDLVGVEAAQGGLTPALCEIDAFTEDLRARCDRTVGLVRLVNVPSTVGIGFTPSYGWPGEPFLADLDPDATGPQQIRVVYDAGFDTVPQPVQEAAVEMVKMMFDIVNVDQTIHDESVGSYSYTANLISQVFTPSVKSQLAMWRDYRS